jgi:hypothetical protein
MGILNFKKKHFGPCSRNKKKFNVIIGDIFFNFSLISCRGRTNKWPLTIFMFMIDAAAQNSYSLIKLQNNVPIDLYRGGVKISLLNIILCLIFKLVNLKWRN